MNPLTDSPILDGELDRELVAYHTESMNGFTVDAISLWLGIGFLFCVHYVWWAWIYCSIAGIGFSKAYRIRVYAIMLLIGLPIRFVFWPIGIRDIGREF